MILWNTNLILWNYVRYLIQTIANSKSYIDGFIIILLIIKITRTNPGRVIQLTDSVGSYRKNYRISSDPTGMRWNLMDPWYWVPIGSCWMSESIGMITVPIRIPMFQHFPNPTTSYRNPIPRFPTNSDRILSDFLDPIGSYWVASPWVGLLLHIQLQNIMHLYFL